MSFPPAFTNAWDTTFPPDTQLANLLGQDLRNMAVNVMQRLSLLSGVIANRPTPETVNAVWGGSGYGITFLSTDTNQLFQWNGSAWVDITSSLPGGGQVLKASNVPVSPSGVTNPASSQNYLLSQLPVGSLAIGSVLKFWAEASFSDTTGIGTLSSSIVTGSGTFLISAHNLPNTTTGIYRLEATGTVISATELRISISEVIGTVNSGTNTTYISGGYFLITSLADQVGIEISTGTGWTGSLTPIGTNLVSFK